MPIDYQSVTVDQYVSTFTEQAGFYIVYQTVGGALWKTASFSAVRRYTGHVCKLCPEYGIALSAPLSFRGATYSGVFTLLPLLTGFV